MVGLAARIVLCCSKILRDENKRDCALFSLLTIVLLISSINVKSHQRSANNTFLLAGLGGNDKSGKANWDLKTLGEWRTQLHHDNVRGHFIDMTMSGVNLLI